MEPNNARRPGGHPMVKTKLDDLFEAYFNTLEAQQILIENKDYYTETGFKCIYDRLQNKISELSGEISEIVNESCK